MVWKQQHTGVNGTKGEMWLEEKTKTLSPSPSVMSVFVVRRATHWTPWRPANIKARITNLKLFFGKRNKNFKTQNQIYKNYSWLLGRKHTHGLKTATTSNNNNKAQSSLCSMHPSFQYHSRKAPVVCEPHTVSMNGFFHGVCGDWGCGCGGIFWI